MGTSNSNRQLAPLFLLLGFVFPGAAMTIGGCGGSTAMTPSEIRVRAAQREARRRMEARYADLNRLQNGTTVETNVLNAETDPSLSVEERNKPEAVVEEPVRLSSRSTAPYRAPRDSPEAAEQRRDAALQRLAEMRRNPTGALRRRNATETQTARPTGAQASEAAARDELEALERRREAALARIAAIRRGETPRATSAARTRPAATEVAPNDGTPRIIRYRDARSEGDSLSERRESREAAAERRRAELREDADRQLTEARMQAFARSQGRVSNQPQPSATREPQNQYTEPSRLSGRPPRAVTYRGNPPRASANARSEERSQASRSTTNGRSEERSQASRRTAQPPRTARHTAVRQTERVGRRSSDTRAETVRGGHRDGSRPAEQEAQRHSPRAPGGQEESSRAEEQSATARANGTRQVDRQANQRPVPETSRPPQTRRTNRTTAWTAPTTRAADNSTETRRRTWPPANEVPAVVEREQGQTVHPASEVQQAEVHQASEERLPAVSARPTPIVEGAGRYIDSGVSAESASTENGSQALVPALAPAPLMDPYQGQRARISRLNAPKRGNHEPLATLVVFSDFTCTACSHLNPALNRLLRTYSSEIQLVFRHNPSADNANAELAAETAVAAFRSGGNGAFWQMHDLLFSHENPITGLDLRVHAVTVGMELEDFEEQLEERQHRSAVAQDRRIAASVDATASPTVFVNGRRLAGQQSFDSLQRVIQQEIRHARRLIAAGVTRDHLYDTLMLGAIDPEVADEEQSR